MHVGTAGGTTQIHADFFSTCRLSHEIFLNVMQSESFSQENYWVQQ